MDANAGRIVVGIDGSSEALHALAWARDEAVLRGAALHVVHAWSPPAPVSEIAAMATAIDDKAYEEIAQDVLDNAIASISADSPATLTVDLALVRGYPSSVLLDEAADADLLVLGSRGRGGFASLLLGSVTHQCVQHTTIPVAVIPASASLPSGDDVVVGVDGSQGARVALRWAVDEAAIRTARLSVVHAWSVPYAVPFGTIGVPPIDPAEVSRESEKLLHELTDPVIASARQKPAEVELLSIEEPAAQALLHRAKDVGMLVVGTRGTGGFAALLLGSVSHQCLHHATCAVVIVPAHE